MLAGFGDWGENGELGDKIALVAAASFIIFGFGLWLAILVWHGAFSSVCAVLLEVLVVSLVILGIWLAFGLASGEWV